MKPGAALLALSIGVAFAADAQIRVNPQENAPKIVAAVCASCHGIDGNSTQPTVPNLAGLQAAYLVKQMRDYNAGKRRNDGNTPCGNGIDPKDITTLADWFSEQKPAAGKPGDPALIAEGRTLYELGHGNGADDDCKDCHKTEGRGGSGLYPRVAGQPVAYTVKQMRAFQSHARSNDKSKVMREAAEKMTEREIRAIAEYLKSL